MRVELTSNEDMLFRARLRYTSLPTPANESPRHDMLSPSRLKLSTSDRAHPELRTTYRRPIANAR